MFLCGSRELDEICTLFAEMPAPRYCKLIVGSNEGKGDANAVECIRTVERVLIECLATRTDGLEPNRRSLTKSSSMTPEILKRGRISGQLERLLRTLDVR